MGTPCDLRPVTPSSDTDPRSVSRGLFRVVFKFLLYRGEERRRKVERREEEQLVDEERRREEEQLVDEERRRGAASG